MSKMVQCPHCGANVDDALTYCTNCGKALPKEVALKPGTCKNGHHFDDHSLKYCPHCSEPLGKWLEGKGKVSGRGSKKDNDKKSFVLRLIVAIVLVGIIVWITMNGITIGGVTIGV